MKKILFVAACLAAVVACNKNSGLQMGMDMPAVSDGECEISLSLGSGSGTKASGDVSQNEKTIRNVQVFIFRADKNAAGAELADFGNLEVAVSYGFSTSEFSGVKSDLNATSGTWTAPSSIKCSTGDREIWVIANDSMDRTAGTNAIKTKAELLASTHSLETSVAGTAPSLSPSKFLMIGHSGTEDNPVISLHEGAQPVSMSVYRQVASIVLDYVENDFYSPAYQQAGTFRLQKVFLLNVPGVINLGKNYGVSAYGSSPTLLNADDWYAKMAPETVVARMALMYDSYGADGQVLNYKQKDLVPHTLYAYPNDCAFTTDVSSFSPRATLLVLEATIEYTGGTRQTYFYPVAIENGLQSNKQYHVSLSIHRPGSMDMNKPVTFSDMTPSITVSDWGDGGTPYDKEI